MHLIEFFAIGAIGFYVAVAMLSLILMALLENEHPRFSATCLVGLFCYLAWSKVFDVVSYAKESPGQLALWIIGYGTVGALSLYPKWYGFVSDELEAQAERIRRSGCPHAGELRAPEPGDHKEQIISWAIYWPWSMLWFVCRHPLRRIGRAIYDGMEKSLTHLSESMTARARLKLEARLRKI